MNWTQRVQQLLKQLETRARKCPGLYPVQSSEDFLRLVQDNLGRGNPAEVRAISDEETADQLEQLWRHPELSYQLNAQSLIQRGMSPFKTDSGDASMEKTAS